MKLALEICGVQLKIEALVEGSVRLLPLNRFWQAGQSDANNT